MSITSSVRVRVPATTANLGPGFDVLGLALQLHSYVSLAPSPTREDSIVALGEGADIVSRLPLETNIALIAVHTAFDALAIPREPLQLTLENAIPLARGLGSSSAARVGALVAANEYIKRRHKKWADSDMLLALATRLEGHPDNVAPALLGGLVISATQEATGQVQSLRLPVEVFPRLVVFIPDNQLETSKARAVLPEQVSRADAIFNIARASLLTGALASGAWQERPALLREALHDKLHQNQRAALMPAYEAASRAALDAGALGVTLSGAGPCILAWLPDDAATVATTITAMQNAAAGQNVPGAALELAVDNDGCVSV